MLSWAPAGSGRLSLWLFSPDGRRRIPLTQDPRYFDAHPSFSPDGRQIAFMRGRHPREPSALWVCQADGSHLRPMATPQGKSERFMSPVWVSNTRVFLVRDAQFDQAPDMEVWRVDVDGDNPQRVFRLADAVGENSGLVTDVSPDGRRLAVIAQRGILWPTADVYVTDLAGKLRQTVWADQPDDRKDARALWSPDARTIAWHHNLSPGGLAESGHYGVGLAVMGTDGQWTTRLQPGDDLRVTPLAWSPQGNRLLCARMQEDKSVATFFLMDDQFRSEAELFALDVACWQFGTRDFARLADWAIVPDDSTPP